jgi:hypothetical protein
LFDLDWGESDLLDFCVDASVESTLEAKSVLTGSVADDTTASVCNSVSVDTVKEETRFDIIATRIEPLIQKCIEYLKIHHVIESSVIDSKKDNSVSHYVLEYHPMTLSQTFLVPVQDIEEQLFDVFIEAYRLILEQQWSVRVFKDQLFVDMYPCSIMTNGIPDSLLSWVQGLGQNPYQTIYGIVTMIELPRFINKSFYYKCENEKCFNRNTMHIVDHGDGFELFKRDSEKKSLGVTCKSNIHLVDLKCSHCGTKMNESVCDGYQEIEQAITVHVTSAQGFFVNGIKK